MPSGPCAGCWRACHDAAEAMVEAVNSWAQQDRSARGNGTPAVPQSRMRRVGLGREERGPSGDGLIPSSPPPLFPCERDGSKLVIRVVYCTTGAAEEGQKSSRDDVKLEIAALSLWSRPLFEGELDSRLGLSVAPATL